MQVVQDSGSSLLRTTRVLCCVMMALIGACSGNEQSRGSDSLRSGDSSHDAQIAHDRIGDGKMPSRSPSETDALLKRAAELVDAGDPVRAESAFSEVLLTAGEKSAMLRAFAGRSLARAIQGNSDSALADLSAGKTLDSLDAGIRNAEAIAFIYLGDRAAGCRTLRELQSTNVTGAARLFESNQCWSPYAPRTFPPKLYVDAPDPSDSDVRAGNRSLSEGRHTDAMQQFSMAIERSPRNTVALNGRAATALVLEDWDTVERDTDRVLRFNTSRSTRVSALVTRSLGRMSMRDERGAINDIGEALQLDSANARVRVLYGVVTYQFARDKLTPCFYLAGLVDQEVPDARETFESLQCSAALPGGGVSDEAAQYCARVFAARVGAAGTEAARANERRLWYERGRQSCLREYQGQSRR